MLDKNLLPELDRKAHTNVEIANHIPIACHYDAETLLTKDGELIQILELSGYETKTRDFAFYDIRKAIRDSLAKNITSYNYSISIHTIRSRKDIMPEGIEPFGLAERLNKRWCKINNWDKQLINTIYISIVLKPKEEKKLSFIEKLSLQKVERKFSENLQVTHKELNATCTKILGDLVVFGARKLSIIQTSSGYISEQLGFYHQLIHLNQRRIPVPVKDLSEFLSATKVNFHFNTIEIVNSDEVGYAALFTVKPTSELSIEKLNNLLQMGSQFIIAQNLYFVPTVEAQHKLKKAYDFLKLARSKVALEKSGLESFMNSNTGKVTDYCMQQTTIMIHSDDIDFFMQKVKTTNSILRDLGLVVVREDFFMPKLFWGQLPGNFRYLKESRMEYMLGKRIGDFCSIYHHLAGSYKGSKWGPPVSLLRSLGGTPFFFNFHNFEGNGNTIVIGPRNSGKTVLKNFFIAQAAKLYPRIIYIDFDGVSKDFIESIGGEYHYIGRQDDLPLKINPFNPSLYTNDVKLFKHWLITAIMPGAAKLPKYDDFFAVLATKLFESQDIPDKIALIESIIRATEDQALIDGFGKILGNGAFSALFSQKESIFRIFDSNNIIGLNLSEISKNEMLTNAYLGLLLVTALEVLDGKPTIITFNCTNKIYQMEYFAPIFGKWLDALTARNAIALCSDVHDDRLHHDKNFIDSLEHFGSKIFMSDKFADKYFRRAFKLSDIELYKIKSYASDRHMFLLTQHMLSIVIALPLDSLKEELELLGKSATHT